MTARGPRVVAIDQMRGLVIVLMSIDHASDIYNGGRFFADAAFFRPPRPIDTAEFMTRWISHLCAPTFVALAGAALAISTDRRRAAGESEPEITRHIVLRGFLVVFLDIGWMSWVFGSVGHVVLQVLYAIGGSLVGMAFLRRLGDRSLLGLGLVLAFGTELLVDGLTALDLGGTAPAVLLLTGGSLGRHVVVTYPLGAWLGIMCLGWCLGRRLLDERRADGDDNHRVAALLARSGVGLLLIFAALRAANGPGNMHLLRQGLDLVEWLHVSKYPPSATYVALELGLAALLLAGLIRLGARLRRVLAPLELLGQTALFYYLVHVHLLRLPAWLLHAEGQLGLASAYVGGASVLVLLLPVCLGYRQYRSTRVDGWTRWI